jgi:uncharacterized protein YndB with AHSA1/START domain
MNLPHTLDRSITIQAAPETVFRFFQDSERFARWWGAGSTIDPHPGGRVYIRHPNGIETVGEVVEIDPPARIVFTYGYASGNPIPPGASMVTITLAPAAGGTHLHLRHDFADAPVRDHHVQGWRFQLSVFGNIVADENFADAAATVDRWFEAWADTDEAHREAAFAELASTAVTFRDRYSMLDGLADLLPHVAATQRFMPGIRMTRAGEIRHCLGLVIADWSAGTMSGTNVFQLGPDRKIAAVTGFWKS